LAVVCLSAGQANAARWENHRANAFVAVDAADPTKAIEQFEAAIYYAQELPAADRDIADLWEHLTAAYLANGEYRRAWDAITRWDRTLAANAGEPWAAEQQSRRDQMTRLVFEQTREPPADGQDAEDPASGPDPATPAQTAEQPELAVEPAGEPVQNAAAPATSSAQSAPERTPDPASYGIHLASFRSEEAARNGWNLLQVRHPDLLEGKSLALRSVELDDRGTYYRLIAVPYPDSAAARSVCRDLQARSQYCAVMRPG